VVSTRNWLVSWYRSRPDREQTATAALMLLARRRHEPIGGGGMHLGHRLAAAPAADESIVAVGWAAQVVGVAGRLASRGWRRSSACAGSKHFHHFINSSLPLSIWLLFVFRALSRVA
jgi:hypothetical protein